MDQTPVHDQHNPELLAMIPPTSMRVIEIGCSSGALAREFKKINPHCEYTGVEIEPEYARQAMRYCDRTQVLNIEHAPDYFFELHADKDCWIFGDVLEHLYDPWVVLKKIRAVLPKNGCVMACIPNAQNWVMQLRLSAGDFRYEDTGLFDRTHIRWFTRKTMTELFEQSGFHVETVFGRVCFYNPLQEQVLPLIGQLAQVLGQNPQESIQDATPLQFIIKAV